MTRAKASGRRKVWTVLGVGGTELHVAGVLPGDVTRQLANEPKPRQWAHVVQAPDPQTAESWARETYLDHIRGLLGEAGVTVEIVAPKAPWALARWRRRKGQQK